MYTLFACSYFAPWVEDTNESWIITPKTDGRPYFEMLGQETIPLLF